MDRGSNGRSGKVISSGHSTRVEGLNKLLRLLEQWPEITTIRLGPIEHKNRVGRKSKKLKTDTSSETGLRVVQAHKRAKGGGGFNFKATRLAMTGSRVTGINCHASNGTNVQLVVLAGKDLDALKSRLQAEGFDTNW
ncbi:MAG: hypothetical protein JWP06_255 [Candidatus Saccharibacteria bacterium]|nr:hypothetical protein [Candidatus Saccharibacteria bacterium]